MRETYFANLHPNEPMISYLRGLREEGLRLGLLTNNVREWEPLWRAKLPDVDELFEVIVDSGFVGMRKPEPEIYELTLERMGDGLRFEECLFLDDIEVNCEAARALGMTAVRFHDNDQAIAELEAALGRKRARVAHPAVDRVGAMPRVDQERALGALVGLAVGDALGAPVEGVGADDLGGKHTGDDRRRAVRAASRPGHRRHRDDAAAGHEPGRDRRLRRGPRARLLRGLVSRRTARA